MHFKAHPRYYFYDRPQRISSPPPFFRNVEHSLRTYFYSTEKKHTRRGDGIKYIP